MSSRDEKPLYGVKASNDQLNDTAGTAKQNVGNSPAVEDFPFPRAEVGNPRWMDESELVTELTRHKVLVVGQV